jgi:hypothetical protein
MGRSNATCVTASFNIERASASQQPQQSEQPVRACSSEKLQTNVHGAYFQRECE